MPDASTVRQLWRRSVPRPVRAVLRDALSGSPRSAGPVVRRGPNDRGGIARLHVGCGPHNLMPGWWNVDIRSFEGLDEVADVTVAWPWKRIDYCYGEHFIEHLTVEQGIAFLAQARERLRPGGRIRLSTPSLEWVWLTHFRPTGTATEVVADTYKANRAFHGWGHEFLYSRPFLEHVLTASGFTDIRFFAYGESDDANLRDLERHGGYQLVDGVPSVWNVEAARPRGTQPEPSPDLAAEIEDAYGRYVRTGH